MPTIKVKKEDGSWGYVTTASGETSSIELDNTLKIEGMAADSKAVGDAIDNIVTQIEDAGSIDIDLGGSNTDVPDVIIDADTLGGYSAEHFATVEQLQEIPVDTGLSMELLWENASPTSEFAAQTISVDCSKYDMLKIFYLRASSSDYIESKEFKTNKAGTVLSIYNYTDSLIGNTRTVRLSGDKKSIEIGNNICAGEGAMNYYCIPVSIYGIKGVN